MSGGCRVGICSLVAELNDTAARPAIRKALFLGSLALST